MIGKKERLFNKALAMHIITGSILILLLTGMLSIIQYRNLTNEKMRTGMFVSSHISIAAVDPIVQTLAYDRIPRVIDELLGSTPHIKYIAVYDLTGNVVASGGLVERKGLSIEQLKDYYQEIPDKSVHILKNDDTQEILAGLSNKEEIIGIVRIGLSNAYIKAQIIRTILLLCGLGLVLLSISILMYFVFLKKKLGRPLAVTTALMEEYRERPDADISGRLKEVLKFQSNNEIGLMMQTFESLITAVETNKEALIARKEELNEEKEKLRRSEEKYRTILEEMEEGYYEVDLAGNFTFFNDAMLGIRGYSRNEMTVMNYKECMDEATAKSVYQIYHKVYTTGRPIKGFEWEIKKKDGTKGCVESSISLKRNSDGIPIGFRGVVRDVTERKLALEEKTRLEDQLHQAQKMEAMGLMAGGVAHDLNNILSGIVSYPELILMDLPEDSPLRKPIKTIKESGMRAVDVVADLLTIARGVAIGKEISNLNTLIEEYLNSAEHWKLVETHPFITFETEIDLDLLNINCSPTHIKKVLMNLIANASEAIGGSGTVTVSTLNRYLDEPLKGYEDVRQGEYAVMTVSDDGSGITPGDLERIFEPFYTKKVMGRSGTGLGLAVVWNTVQDHKGYINVNTGEKGTVFELYFPVTREEVAAEKEEVPLEDYLGQGEKILVVDDEERQREIASGILSRLGYIAEVVSSGEEAVEYVKKHPVDLIVLDMVMPKGINGRETYEEIVKIRPEQKAIIASGYVKTKEVDLAQELGAGKYIKKPYTLAKVGIAVKEELEKRKPEKNPHQQLLKPKLLT